MIWQTHDQLNRNINLYGCYWMALLWHVVRIRRLSIDPEWLERRYDRHVKMGWIRENCFVLNPTAVLRDVGLKTETVTDPLLEEPWKLRPSYLCKDNEIEILKWTNGENHHFTAGNGYGRITYDPMGISRTASQGIITSKRVFGRLE